MVAKTPKARKNARQRVYRAANVKEIEKGKKMSRGRVKAREFLKKEGKQIEQPVVEKMARKYVRNLKRTKRAKSM